jgi:hypothetical protein
VSVAWPPFEKALASGLAQLEEDQYLVISAKRGDRFVQFAGQGSFGMRAETVSNGFLPKAEQLSDEQIAALVALGWSSPTGTPETSTPETAPDGSPNFFVDFAQPVRHQAIAKLAVRTLTEVLCVPHPGFLHYEAFGDDGPVDLPVLGLKVRKAVTPVDDVVSLQQKLLAALREATGVEALEFDGDGDIPVRLGSAISFTRVIEEPPMIRITSPIVSEIEEDLALLAKLNEFNANSDVVRYVHRNCTLYAVADLLARPFVAAHVIRAFRDFMAVADGFDEVIRTAFGGQTAFKDEFRSSLRH